MDHDTILAKIEELLQDLTEDDTLKITDETVADDVELWDSILHVKLVLAIESEFGIRFDAKEIGAQENVGALVNTVQAKLKANA